MPIFETFSRPFRGRIFENRFFPHTDTCLKIHILKNQINILILTLFFFKIIFLKNSAKKEIEALGWSKLG